MNCPRLLSIIAVMLASTTLSAVPGNAAVPERVHAANQTTPAKLKTRKARVAKNARQARRNKEKARRIAAYKLFRDPQFKLEGVITDRRQLDAITRSGAAYASAARRMPASHTSATGIPQSAFKTSQQDATGLDFNCHEKILSPSIANRETSACYQYELSKTWKAQTYVSRQRTEGNWGGGLSLGFAY